MSIWERWSHLAVKFPGRRALSIGAPPRRACHQCECPLCAKSGHSRNGPDSSSGAFGLGFKHSELLKRTSWGLRTPCVRHAYRINKLQRLRFRSRSWVCFARHSRAREIEAEHEGQGGKGGQSTSSECTHPCILFLALGADNTDNQAVFASGLTGCSIPQLSHECPLWVKSGH